jgi:hypothetical protein
MYKTFTALFAAVKREDTVKIFVLLSRIKTGVLTIRTFLHGFDFLCESVIT